ncbi:hypothetical protein [Crocosphaera sp. Alani8]|uniref:hypothetical protein n=1 Tax=Crocosphaera sp. Alani8 TaxID=3038952 RepID=UPI00313C28DD
MKITDLEHLGNVTKPEPTVQGGFINFEAFSFAEAKGSKIAWTWTNTYTVAIAL